MKNSKLRNQSAGVTRSVRKVSLWGRLFIVMLSLSVLYSDRQVAIGEPAGDEDSLELADIIKPSPQSPATATKNSGAADDESIKDLEKIIDSQETNENRQAPARTARPERAKPVESDFDDGSDREVSQAEFPATEEGEGDLPPSNKAGAPVQGDPYVRNVLNNLEFRQDGLKSRIIVTSRSPLRFREVKNPAMKQVIYFFENTETPERLQRAYDTTEFVSPVALFTLLQMPKESPPNSKLIVQLREDSPPTVITSERGLYIEFGAPTSSGPRRHRHSAFVGE